MNAELLKKFKYYVSHQDELVQKYDGKYIVINDQKVVGVYDDDTEAIEKASEKYELGKFLVHLVGPGKSNYTRAYRS